MGTNLGLPAPMGKDIYFFIFLHQGSQFAWLAEIPSWNWTSFTFFSGMSQNLEGYVWSREWVKVLSPRDSDTHVDTLLTKPPSPWYLVALCLHAAYGAQALLLSLGSWGPTVPPLEVLFNCALERPYATSSGIIPENKRVLQTSSLSKTPQDGSRTQKAYHPLTCSGAPSAASASRSSCFYFCG